MQVALICPPAILKKYGTLTRYHLTLPHLSHQKRYQDFYQTRSRRGDYVILDNGAAEGAEFGPRHLFTVAEMLGAHEIVVPDVLAEKEESLANALAWNRHARNAPGEFKYMAVAQGRNVMEVIQSIHFILETTALMYITCIGIPRLICDLASRTARVGICEYIQTRGLDSVMMYHMLGGSRWKEEILELKHFTFIRGIDTSMPVVMGLEGRDLLTDEYTSRKEDFFDVTTDDPMVKKNIDTYLQWSRV